MKRIWGSGLEGPKRVLRGGSWINHARNTRSANRNANDPGNSNDNTGLRLARAQRWAGRPPLTRPLSRPPVVDRRQKASGPGSASSEQQLFGERSPGARPLSEAP